MKLLKFYSPTCGQCKVLDKEFKAHPINVSIYRNINIEEDEEMTAKYNVRNLPTVILLNDLDEVVARWHGIVKSDVINEKIRRYEKYTTPE